MDDHQTNLGETYGQNVDYPSHYRLLRPQLSQHISSYLISSWYWLSVNSYPPGIEQAPHPLVRISKHHALNRATTRLVLFHWLYLVNLPKGVSFSWNLKVFAFGYTYFPGNLRVNKIPLGLLTLKFQLAEKDALNWYCRLRLVDRNWYMNWKVVDGIFGKTLWLFFMATFLLHSNKDSESQQFN